MPSCFLKNSGSQNVLLEKGHMGICELTDGKCFLYFFSPKMEKSRDFSYSHGNDKDTMRGPKGHTL